MGSSCRNIVYLAFYGRKNYGVLGMGRLSEYLDQPQGSVPSVIAMTTSGPRTLAGLFGALGIGSTS